MATAIKRHNLSTKNTTKKLEIIEYISDDTEIIVEYMVHKLLHKEMGFIRECNLWRCSLSFINKMFPQVQEYYFEKTGKELSELGIRHEIVRMLDEHPNTVKRKIDGGSYYAFTDLDIAYHKHLQIKVKAIDELINPKNKKPKLELL